MDRATSLYLDIVRPAAALVVLLSHVSQAGLTGGQLDVFASAGVQAVDVFFVLSGFVIAHVCAVREQDARSYFVSRAARIYSVAIPALFLTACADVLGRTMDAASYDGIFQPMTPGLVVRSLLFLGEQWTNHRFPGSNGPYWSLGFEVWYYAAFGVLLFAPRALRWAGMAAVLGFIGPKVAIMFPVWLMGVAAYCACRRQRLSLASGWVLFAAPVALLAGYELLPHSGLQQFAELSLDPDRLKSMGRDYLVAALFCLHIVGFARISAAFLPWLDRHAGRIRWIAGATFSIYLMHLPIMHVLAAASPWPKASPLRLVLLLVVTPAACLLLAEVSERRKAAWRQAIEFGVRSLEPALLARRKAG